MQLPSQPLSPAFWMPRAAARAMTLLSTRPASRNFVNMYTFVPADQQPSLGEQVVNDDDATV